MLSAPKHAQLGSTNLVGAAAANLGWHVTYLGASLPAAEIAGAARQNRARAVALSLVYSVWLGLVLAASGAFVLFEALRGWCALQACGIKTRL